MKKSILFLFFMTLLQALSAQEAERVNKYFVSGSFNFRTQNNTFPLNGVPIYSGIGTIYSSSTNETTNTTFSFRPGFGKEINPKLFAGAYLSYRINKYKAKDIRVFVPNEQVDFKRTTNEIGIGVYTRHKLIAYNQLSFFMQPHIGFNLVFEDVYHDAKLNNKEKARYFRTGVGLGLMYDINDKIRAVLNSGGLNYVRGKWEKENSTKEKDFSSFGIDFYLSSYTLGFEVRI